MSSANPEIAPAVATPQISKSDKILNRTGTYHIVWKEWIETTHKESFEKHGIYIDPTPHSTDPFPLDDIDGEDDNYFSFRPAGPDSKVDFHGRFEIEAWKELFTADFSGEEGKEAIVNFSFGKKDDQKPGWKHHSDLEELDVMDENGNPFLKVTFDSEYLGQEPTCVIVWAKKCVGLVKTMLTSVEKKSLGIGKEEEE